MMGCGPLYATTSMQLQSNLPTPGRLGTFGHGFPIEVFVGFLPHVMIPPQCNLGYASDGFGIARGLRRAAVGLPNREPRRGALHLPTSCSPLHFTICHSLKSVHHPETQSRKKEKNVKRENSADLSENKNQEFRILSFVHTPFPKTSLLAIPPSYVYPTPSPKSPKMPRTPSMQS
jgi:hypothetical protein